MSHGYYMYPTVHGDQVVFVSEDDLWTVPLQGGTARRLTAGIGHLSRPLFSRCGKWIAFSNEEEGPQEVSVMPSAGGPSHRLTYFGAMTCRPVMWTPQHQIVLATDAEHPHRVQQFFMTDLDGGLPKPMNLGPATNIAMADDGTVIIERNSWRSDPAHWKRYRGGTAGKFWIADRLDGEFKPFLNLKGNLACPMWIGSRLYFVSDHEGVGNLYSCKKSGEDLQKHTDSREFYVRNPTTDGKNIVFHSGGDLFALDVKANKATQIPIEYFSQRTQRQRRFVDPKKYFEEYALHPLGHKVSITSRGQVFEMGNWEGPVQRHGAKPSVRYRLSDWLCDNETLVVVSDDGGEERLEAYSSGSMEPRITFDKSLGRVTQMAASPTEKKIAFANHRCELAIADLDSNKLTLVDQNSFGPMEGFDWSPCGGFLSYSVHLESEQRILRIYDLALGKSFDVTAPFISDRDPKFSPDGKYLYFLSNRELDPVYDSLVFNISFPSATVPCLVTLKKETTSPFLKEPAPANEKEEKGGEGGKEDSKSEKASRTKTAKTEIDFEGISERVLAFPVRHGLYSGLQVTPKKIFWQREPVEGEKGTPWIPSEPTAKGWVECFDFETLKAEKFVKSVSSFRATRAGKHLAIRSGKRFRVLSATEKPDEKAGDEFNKKSGWVDLDRIKVLIEPGHEWSQMLKEVWRLQRDHYWVETMSGIKWDKLIERYGPLVGRVSTRREFSDLVWELQGELATSHAYDIGGDYRLSPQYKIGFLGADFEWDQAQSGFRITQILRSDIWDASTGSPLSSPGVNAKAGDFLLAINGQALHQALPPQRALLNLAGQEVRLALKSAESGAIRHVTIKTLKDEGETRYRNWVEANRDYVRKKSDGRLGYVHIPDMSAMGFAEFYRSFLGEFNRDGLIVDVRYNGGGHVSQLVLQRLTQKPIGMNQARWFGSSTYPGQVSRGPLVALTNEYAGSDGDIFSHSFKLLKLGPLIGKRTWGGVIGIWPRHRLTDGSLTTQPEFSFWFEDVGWGVENYGTDPTIEVDDAPHEYRKGLDAQLDRGIAEAMKLIETHPPFRPELKDFPQLS